MPSLVECVQEGGVQSRSRRLRRSLRSQRSRHITRTESPGDGRSCLAGSASSVVWRLIRRSPTERRIGGLSLRGLEREGHSSSRREHDASTDPGRSSPYSACDRLPDANGSPRTDPFPSHQSVEDFVCAGCGEDGPRATPCPAPPGEQECGSKGLSQKSQVARCP